MVKTRFAKCLFKTAFVVLWQLLVASCDSGRTNADNDVYDLLRQDISGFVEKLHGKIGVAVITDCKDTLTVNNTPDFPLMSMFKLHQSIAICRNFGENGIGLDSVLNIKQCEMNKNTWSPMLKNNMDKDFLIPVSGLLEYILVHSDNNASNLLFNRVVSVAETDSIVASILPDRGFRLMYNENEMLQDKSLSYKNVSSPLAYALMIDKLFTDSVMPHSMQAFVKQAMYNCETGMGRIAAPLADIPGVAFAHRTGSGYVNPQGEIIAVNDGGYVTLPSGQSYSIAVFVKDFAGTQDEAESVIAKISELVYNRLSELK